MNFIDAFGLYQCPTAPLYDGSCLIFGGGGGSPGGATCTEDGAITDCGHVLADVGSGLAAQCPNNQCTGWKFTTDNSGNGVMFQNGAVFFAMQDSSGGCTVSGNIVNCVLQTPPLVHVAENGLEGTILGQMLDPNQCPNCNVGRIFNSASDWVSAATIYTAVGVAAVPATAEFATSTAGDLLFAQHTGLLNSNNFARIGWSWYGRNIIDYLPVGGLVFRIVVGKPNGPIHWHIWPF